MSALLQLGGGRFFVAPLCLTAAMLVFAVTTPSFLTAGNLASMAGQMWVLGLLAVGQMFAVVTRGFDISVGSVAALASTVAAMSANILGLSGLLAGPFVGLLCGTVTGILIGALGLQPIVATLAMLIGVRGLALLVTDNGQVVPLTVPNATSLAFDPVFLLPPTAWMALVAVIAAAWLLNRSSLGRRLVMLGSNPEAVQLVGISRCRTTVAAYQLSGLFAGCAGILMTLRAGVGLPTEGSGMELQSIAAAVIGGTALTGGTASVLAVVLGAAFIQALLTGLNLQGVSPFAAQIAVGVVIVGSSLLDYAIRRVLPQSSSRRRWT